MVNFTHLFNNKPIPSREMVVDFCYDSEFDKDDIEEIINDIHINNSIMSYISTEDDDG